MSDNTTKVTTHYWLPLQETNNGFVIKFYANHDQVEFPVIKLFAGEFEPPDEEDFIEVQNQFPSFWAAVVNAGVDTNPPRESKTYVNLLKDGMLNELTPPLEFIVDLNENGKAKKRVNWPATLAFWAGKPAAGNAGEAGERRVYKMLGARDKLLLDSIGADTIEIAMRALDCVNHIYTEAFDPPEGIEPTTSFSSTDFSATEMFKTIFYSLNKKLELARGAWVVDWQSARKPGNDLNNILNGEFETFKADLIDGHYLMETAEDVDEAIEMLGIKITSVHKDSAEERANVAKRVWLYFDLARHYGYTRGEAVEAVNALMDQVPF
jgi:hypothetical protein